MIVIGIDIGLSGALACHGKGLIAVADMPTMQRGDGGATVRYQVNAAGLAELLRAWIVGYDKNEVMVVIEKVSAMPRALNGRSQGGASTFSLGLSAGIVEGVVSAMHLPHELVPPARWKAALKVPKGKPAARALAQRLYPGVNLSRVKDHNRAEAILIGLYGYRKHA
ncbi:MAG TPA: hypothetical protein VMU55_06495 [Solirubrobacteraceae bacterium]|nr:hypothetical protein [Solirubrobacteraceae bacterium]